MAKITLTPYDKDDPIFTEGLSFFKPISRPPATEKEANTPAKRRPSGRCEASQEKIIRTMNKLFSDNRHSKG